MGMRIPQLRLFANDVKKHQESLIENKRFSIIGSCAKTKTLIIHDNELGIIAEVCVLNYIKQNLELHCLHCKSYKCDHTIFSFYTHEITTMKQLGDILNLPEPIRRRLQERKSYIKAILIRNIIPAVLLMALSIGLLPFFTTIDTSYWHVFNEMENVIRTLRT